MTIKRREFLGHMAAGSAILTVPAFLNGCSVQQATAVAEPMPDNPFTNAATVLDWSNAWNTAPVTDPAGGIAIEPEVAQVTVVRGGHSGTIWYEDIFRTDTADIALRAGTVRREGDRFVVETDCVIVGSGAGGAVVAAELAADSDERVLVLEKGHFIEPHITSTIIQLQVF